MNLIDKIRLLFKPSRVSMDFSGGKDYTVQIKFKMLNGKMYLLESAIMEEGK